MRWLCVNLSVVLKRGNAPVLMAYWGKVLKCCAWQLLGTFSYISQSSLQQQKVWSMWKESAVVPVAEVTSPEALRDYHPVTSLVMKTSEHLVKSEVLHSADDMLDLLQFAYRATRGTCREITNIHICFLFSFLLLLIVFSQMFLHTSSYPILMWILAEWWSLTSSWTDLIFLLSTFDFFISILMMCQCVNL